MARVLLLFIGVPVLELALLIEIGGRIGTLSTLALILSTGLVGATLARREGLDVLARARRQLAGGELPTIALMDGAMILVASALLITPGVLTDAAGFLLLYPGFRSRLRSGLRRRWEHSLREADLHVEFARFDLGGSAAWEEPIDVTPPRGAPSGHPPGERRGDG